MHPNKQLLLFCISLFWSNYCVNLLMWFIWNSSRFLTWMFLENKIDQDPSLRECLNGHVKYNSLELHVEGFWIASYIVVPSLPSWLVLGRNQAYCAGCFVQMAHEHSLRAYCPYMYIYILWSRWTFSMGTHAPSGIYVEEKCLLSHSSGGKVCIEDKFSKAFAFSNLLLCRFLPPN